MRVACALLAIAACGDDGGASTDAALDGPSSSAWSTGTAVGHGAIQETAAVAVAGKIYVIGGFDDDEGIVGRVQIYDTASATWSDGPALPMAVHHANAVTDGATIFVLGALTGTGFTAIGDTYKLAPATDTQWSALAAMPAGRERGAAVTGLIGGKVYVAGGFRNAMASDLVDVYDPGTDSWTALAPLPATRDHACGAAIGGELVVVGGRMVQTSSPRADVWSYAPATDTWTVRAPMPTARGGMGCGAISGVLYTAGGEGNAASPAGVFPDVEAFTPVTNSWSTLAPMPNPKHGVGGAVWDGALYLCGGASKEGFGAIAATDVFRP